MPTSVPVGAPIRACGSRRLALLPAAVIALCFGLFQAPAGAQSYEAGLDAVDAGDLPAAVAIWRELISSDSDERPQAEYAMALLYETGQGVEQNMQRALELDYDTGLRGLPEAQWAVCQFFQWAVCQFFEKGVGVKVDVAEAAIWCQRAAAVGHGLAAEALPDLLFQAATAPGPLVAPDDAVASDDDEASALPSVPALTRTADEIATLFEPPPPPAPESAPTPTPEPQLETDSTLETDPTQSLQTMVDEQAGGAGAAAARETAPAALDPATSAP